MFQLGPGVVTYPFFTFITLDEFCRKFAHGKMVLLVKSLCKLVEVWAKVR